MNTVRGLRVQKSTISGQWSIFRWKAKIMFFLFTLGLSWKFIYTFIFQDKPWSGIILRLDHAHPTVNWVTNTPNIWIGNLSVTFSKRIPKSNKLLQSWTAMLHNFKIKLYDYKMEVIFPNNRSHLSSIILPCLVKSR